jgi:hypothetical protein
VGQGDIPMAIARAIENRRHAARISRFRPIPGGDAQQICSPFLSLFG